MSGQSNLHRLLLGHRDNAVAQQVSSLVAVHPAIAGERGPSCSREVIAMALNLGLLADLLDRVPTARAYFADLAESAGTLTFDHGALRTVALEGMGNLPAGQEAITRVLRPLGYASAETYPLDRLKMTGRAWRHQDYPADLPQFFVSELHVDRFSAAFAAAALRVTGTSSDPLDASDVERLARLERDHSLPIEEATALLGKLVACFQRRHAAPALADYELLLAESAEMAWIATEGNAFNHATDRVADLAALADEQRALGRAIKDGIEVSATGRVRQTAYRADPVLRPFVDADGAEVTREVPGSFFEFIQREHLPDGGALDLSFDTGNAQGIFKMTAAV